ncbi:MAG: GAF domain-containing protein [Deltaproteobacteria bacterium]|nr:GAF domain-containing protein [Deltaproteobacteria bacterium]
MSEVMVTARICQLGLHASQTEDLDSVAREMLRIAVEVSGATFAGLATTDMLHQEVVLRWAASSEGGTLPEGARRYLGCGLAGRAAKRPGVLSLEDLPATKDLETWLPGMLSSLAIPLQVGEGVVGILCLESPIAGRLRADGAWLEELTRSLSMAIRNLRSVEVGRHRLNQLMVLGEVSRIITSTMDLDVLLQRTADCVREQLGYQIVGIGLVDDDTGRVIHCAASSEHPMPLPIGHKQAVGEGVTGEVVKTGRSILVGDVRHHDNYVMLSPNVRSELCAPLRDGTRTFGFLDAESDTPYAFDAEDRSLLEMVAEHMSQAISNARSLKQIGRLRKDMTSMLVHDLRSPLGVVLTSLEVLRMALVRQGMTERLRVLDAAQSASEEMLILVSGLLDLNKLEAGEFPVRPRMCQPHEIVRSVIGRLSVVAAARQVSLEAAPTDGAPAAMLDVDLITRVLENLAANGLKYTPEGGRVLIAVEPASSEVTAGSLPGCGAALLFTVSDNGPEIPSEARDRIFEMFATAEPRRSDVRHSTGLGLAFCKRAVEAHGGSIWLACDGASGNRFQFLLPHNRPEASAGTRS